MRCFGRAADVHSVARCQLEAFSIMKRKDRGYAATEIAAVPGWSIIAVDQAKASLDVAKAAYEAVKPNLPSSNATFLHAPIDRLPLADASVDVVLLFSVLEEMPDLRAAFREVPPQPRLRSAHP